MHLSRLISEVVKNVILDKNIPCIEEIDIVIERPKDEKFGDYSTNIAMRLAKPLKKSPVVIANELKEEFEKNSMFEKVEIAGAGFINFYLNPDFVYKILDKIILEKENYGKSSIGNKEKVMVEYVSANPTGYLHVGHGRGAVVGDVIANILNFAGYDVFREYYVNDAGSQIDKLAQSVYLRYKEILERWVTDN